MLNYRSAWLWLTFYLTAYEIFEVALLFFSLKIFLPETIKDQVTDILVGLIGGGLCYLLLIAKREMRTELYSRISPEAIFTSLTLAFLWIGNAKFFIISPYSDGIFSDPWFIIFSIGGYVFLQTFSRMKKKISYRYKGILFYSAVVLIVFLSISSFQSPKMGESPLKANALLLLFSLLMIYPFLSIWCYNKSKLVFSRSAERLYSVSLNQR